MASEEQLFLRDLRRTHRRLTAKTGLNFPHYIRLITSLYEMGFNVDEAETKTFLNRPFIYHKNIQTLSETWPEIIPDIEGQYLKPLQKLAAADNLGDFWFAHHKIGKSNSGIVWLCGKSSFLKSLDLQPDVLRTVWQESLRVPKEFHADSIIDTSLKYMMDWELSPKLKALMKIPANTGRRHIPRAVLNYFMHSKAYPEMSLFEFCSGLLRLMGVHIIHNPEKEENGEFLYYHPIGHDFAMRKIHRHFPLLTSEITKQYKVKIDKHFGPMQVQLAQVQFAACGRLFDMAQDFLSPRKSKWRTSSAIVECYGDLADLAAMPPTRHRTYGVEFECYAPDPQATGRYLFQLKSFLNSKDLIWQQKEDHSFKVKPGYIGAEIASPVIDSTQFYQAGKLGAFLQNFGCFVEEPNALHVHTGIRDVHPEHFHLPLIKQVISLYRALADDLSFLDSELTWSYQRVQDIHGMSNAEFTEAILGARSIGELSGIIQPMNRRRAPINLLCYEDYGTIEFRQHPGTLHEPKITGWLKFIDELMRTAEGMLIINDLQPVVPLYETDGLKLILRELASIHPNTKPQPQKAALSLMA